MSLALSESDRPVRVGGGDSLTRIDPRARVISAILFAIITVALNRFSAIGAALLVAIALLLLSGLPLRKTLKRMAMMDGFVIFMILMLPFTVPGTPVFSIWGIDASQEGFLQGFEIALTANAVVLALMSLVGSMEPVTLGHALYKLRFPERLVHLMMFTIRYIDVLSEENHRLRNSMKVRGFRPRTNWHTYRSYGYLVGMMLVRALERSERILNAMKCRGFKGRIVLLERFRYGRADLIFALIMTAALLTLIALELL